MAGSVIEVVGLPIPDDRPVFLAFLGVRARVPVRWVPGSPGWNSMRNGHHLGPVREEEVLFPAGRCSVCKALLSRKVVRRRACRNVRSVDRRALPVFAQIYLQ